MCCFTASTFNIAYTKEKKQLTLSTLYSSECIA